MLVVDDLEHEREKSAKDLVTILEIETHVERFNVCKILQQVKVSAN